MSPSGGLGDNASVAADEPDDDYTAFVTAYGGYDVRDEPWFRTLADLQELRWTAFVADKAAHDPDAAAEVSHRLACLRGEIPRPWKWSAF